MQHVDTQHIVGGVSAPLAPKKSRHVFEKEIKNKVAQVFFDRFDCTIILGRIGFSTAESRNSWCEQKLLFKGDTQDIGYFLWADLLSNENEALAGSLYVLHGSNTYAIIKEKINELGLSTIRTGIFTDRLNAHKQFWNRYRRLPCKDFWLYIVDICTSGCDFQSVYSVFTSCHNKNTAMSKGGINHRIPFRELQSHHKSHGKLIAQKVYEHGFLSS